jgi:hypothetical protein
MAWVKPRPGAHLTADGLEAATRGRIAGYKVPRHWRIVDEFPMTVTGKVQKFRLRELALNPDPRVTGRGRGRPRPLRSPAARTTVCSSALKFASSSRRSPANSRSSA